MKLTRALPLVLLFLAFLQIQCLLIPDDTEKGTRVANQRPSVRITAGAATDDTSGVDYKVLFRWNGVDVDGVVSLYQYAVDDTISERAWNDTTGFSALLRFTATTQDQADPDESRFTDWHTFYIRAVDNENSVSLPDHRFFNARTIAPVTTITFPANLSQIANLQQTLVVRWRGEDLDSSRPEKEPVAWEYKLAPVNDIVNDTDEEIEESLLESDNILLDTLQVGDKTRWVRVPRAEDSIRLANLLPESQLVFGVRAIDEAGAVEPSLDRNRNYIAFIVTGEIGRPLVTVREPASGQHVFGREEDVWDISVAAGRELRFSWEGDASDYGSLPGNSNYGLNIPDPEDETIRDPNGIGGWIGWGSWRQTVRPIVFTNADAGQTHNLWIKMRDISENRESERLCQVRILVVPFTFDKLALVLDDSKFQAAFPSDAQHDEFIQQVFARRFLDFEPFVEYPLWGSPERASPENADRLQLATLAQYQYLIWHKNRGATDGEPISIVENQKGFLSTYLSAGGRLLLVGDRISSGLLNGVYRYPKNPTGTNPDFDSEDRAPFIWNFMRIRNEIISVRSDAQPAETQASGLVGARSLHPAFPDIELDETKWNPWRVVDNSYLGGIRSWEGFRGTYRPIERLAGLDSLYAPVTFDTTFNLGTRRSGYDDAILGWRYESTRIDTLTSTQQGRTVVFDFQPFFFDADAMQDAGTSAINWLITGKDH